MGDEHGGYGPNDETLDHSGQGPGATRPGGGGSGGEGPPPPPGEGPPPGEPPQLPERYGFIEELGAGGQGAVFLVFDRTLEREAALKTVHAEHYSPAEKAFFLREARAAASLEHPNVVPVYDLGELPDGRPYYTMRRVTGRNLGDVLRACEDGEAPDWTLMRLVGVVQQLSRGLQAAHERGLVHRDVKPANVLVGALDEVLVVDWGIAKGSGVGPETTTGVVKGTAHYLAPEQVRGEKVRPASDLHAIGVVLYQVLTLARPYDAATGGEIIASILRDPPPDPESVSRAPWAVPPELASLAMRLLEKDPADRPQSAREVADELRAFLEGVRDRERRRAAADALLEEGRRALAAHDASQAELAGLREEIACLEDEHPPWQPVEEKLPLIDARARVAEVERGAWTSFLAGVNRFTDALVHVPDHPEVRAKLADLFWERFAGAEERREEALAETCRMLVERWHDGRYSRELEGHGRIELEVFPKTAELVLHPLVEKNLVLVDGPGRPLGAGDLSLDDVPMGSYVIVATAPGHEPARYPVCIRRCETWTGRLRLLEEGALPEGFVHVPGATVWLGGDPLASNGWPRRQVEIESFAIGRFVVTFGEWCEFLDDIGAADESDPVPCAEPLGHLCRRDPNTGRFEVDAPALLEEELFERFGREVVRRLPVLGVNYDLAGRYCAWLGDRLGAAVELPSAEQWEYAARGADERVRPWGRSFDAALCFVRGSTEGTPFVPPVGAAPFDRSVFGARDMAGCVQEWTRTWFDEGRALHEVRGGGWAAGDSVTLSAWRGACPAPSQSLQLGFRTCFPLD